MESGVVYNRRMYEVAYKCLVPNSSDDDYESVEFRECGSYREAVKEAERASTEHTFENGRHCDVASVVCYRHTEITEYDEIFEERYKDGKMEFRYYI